MQTEPSYHLYEHVDGRYEPTPGEDDVDPLRLENFDRTACIVRLGEKGAHFYFLDDVVRLLERDHSNPITRGVIGLQDVRPLLTCNNGPAYLRTVVRLVQKGWTGMDEVAMFDAAQQNTDTAEGLETLLTPLRRMLARTNAHFAIMVHLMRARPSMDEKTRASIAIWKSHHLMNARPPTDADKQMAKKLVAAERAAVENRRKFKGLAPGTSITSLDEAADLFVGMHEHLLSSHVNATLSRETTIDAFLSVLPIVLSASSPKKPKLPNREVASWLLDARFIHAVTPRLSLTRYYIVNPASVKAHLCDHVFPRLTAAERQQMQEAWHAPQVVCRLVKVVMMRALHSFREYTSTEIATGIVKFAEDFFVFETNPHRMRMHDMCQSRPFLDPLGADIPFHLAATKSPLTEVLDTCVGRTDLLPFWNDHMQLPSQDGDACFMACD
jgi:hypothetical protein